jgi:acetyl-CoA C-acetyltransferase
VSVATVTVTDTTATTDTRRGFVTSDDRLPVVVATGQSIERLTTVSALDLAERAARVALDRVPKLQAEVQQVSVVNIISPAGSAPGADLSRRLHLSPARTETTTVGGNSPQWLVNRAAKAISAGDIDVVLIAGAEAQRSAREGGSVPDDRGHTAGPPDPVIGDDRPPVSPAEFQAGLIAPIHLYALFESVIAHRAGRSPAEHRAELGRLLAPFTTVAAAHDYAWFPDARTPAELSEITPDNRLISEPYAKNMCAMFTVDQGAAVVVTSLAAARRAGVDEEAVFCWSGAECTDVWFPAARPDPGTAPAMSASTSAALEAAGTGVDELSAFDLYSCFPCAVELAADALGVALDDERRLTVTGGLPYFGGPGNNYSLHAVATMVDRLRVGGGTGLVTAFGWYLTKHAAGVYGAEPPPRGWRPGDTTAAQAAIDATAVEIATEAAGPAVVVASTVVNGRGGEITAAPVIARLEDGRHIAAAADVSELPCLAARNLVGSRIDVRGPPLRYRISG